MTDEHSYSGFSHEVIVENDPIRDIKLSIADLTETVKKLAEKVYSPPEEPSAYPKQTMALQEQDEVSLHGSASSLVESSLGGSPIEDEPPRKLSKRTSFVAEMTNIHSQSHISKRTISHAAESNDGKSSDINALVKKSKNNISEGKKSATFDVEEEILSAVEAERPPGSVAPTGDPILPNLAERVVKYWQTDVKKAETFKILQEKYKTPSNCTTTTTPLINDVIYHSLSAYTKRLDHEMAEIQKYITTATNSIIQISQSVLEADKKSTMIDSKEIVKMCFDGITTLGTAHAKLNNKRKQAISSHLDPDIKDVCSSRHVVTGYLFGDDLPKAIKDAKEVSKLTKSVASQSQYSKGKRKQQYAQHGASYNYSQNSNYGNSSNKTSFFQKAKKPHFKQKKPFPYKN
eukprot:gene13520-14932_t